MMTGRWRVTQTKDNHGKSLVVYCCGDYELCLNINNGREGPGVRDKHGHHWQFEVTYRGEHIGEALSLAGAKRVAAKFEKGLQDAKLTFEATYPEVAAHRRARKEK